MKANETKVEDFLSSNKTQFVIPVYQRNYDWTTGQCKQLLDDILEVGTNKKMNGHFIGSIVYVHDDVYQTSPLSVVCNYGHHDYLKKVSKQRNIRFS